MVCAVCGSLGWRVLGWMLLSGWLFCVWFCLGFVTLMLAAFGLIVVWVVLLLIGC